MKKPAVLLALACVANGRRVQHPIDRLESHVAYAELEANATSPQSLIELTPHVTRAVSSVTSRLSGFSHSRQEQRISPGAKVNLSSEHHLLTASATHQASKSVNDRTDHNLAASAAFVPERAGIPQADHQEPWYANTHRNLLILVAAKVCTRIGIMFRSRSASLGEKNPALASSMVGSHRASAVAMNVDASDAPEKKIFNIDFGLVACVTLWYLGNYYYNITNKLALNAAGGVSGLPLTVSTLQLLVGLVYAAFLWAAPDARKLPTITFKDWVATLPVSAASAAGHALTVVAFSAGSVSFGQIIKAGEPACAALMGLLFYNAPISRNKWLALIPVIGGVCLASLGELSFAWIAFVSALLSNIAGAIRANENKKLMSTPGISERLGSVGNQYAISTLNQLLLSIPVMLLFEGSKLGPFFQLCKTSPVLFWNMVYSGMWYYLYNELSTIVIEKTNAVTQTVLSTAKRVIIIVGVAFVLGESLPPIKLIGSLIGIAGVFLYSLAK